MPLIYKFIVGEIIVHMRVSNSLYILEYEIHNINSHISYLHAHKKLIYILYI